MKPNLHNFSAAQYDLSFAYNPPVRNDFDALERNPLSPPPSFLLDIAILFICYAQRDYLLLAIR